MWVNLKAPNSVVFDKNEANGYTIVLGDNGDIKIVIKWDNGYEYYKINGATWFLNRWIHVVFSWVKNERIILYINGCAAQSGQIYSISRRAPLSMIGVFIIGAARPISLQISYLANMAIDEFQVLSYSDICHLYTVGGKHG